MFREDKRHLEFIFTQHYVFREDKRHLEFIFTQHCVFREDKRHLGKSKIKDFVCKLKQKHE